MRGTVTYQRLLHFHRGCRPLAVPDTSGCGTESTPQGKRGWKFHDRSNVRTTEKLGARDTQRLFFATVTLPPQLASTAVVPTAVMLYRSYTHDIVLVYHGSPIDDDPFTANLP